MSRICVAMCLLGLVLAAPALGQGYQSPMTPASAQLRFGIGVTFTTSLYFPGDLNDLTDDIVDAYAPFQVDNSAPLIFGVGGRVQAQLTMGNMIQLEPWVEYLYGGEKRLDLYYYYSDYSYYEDDELKLSFKPSYIAPGVTLYLTPGMGSGLYPKLGVGLGLYRGKVRVEESLSQTYYDYDTGITDYYHESLSEDYKGSALGLHAVVGIAFAATDNFHIEASILARYAKINKLENDDGEELVNALRDDKKVTLDFSGVDFRLGGSVVF